VPNKTKKAESDSIPVITPQNKQTQQSIMHYGKTYQILNTNPKANAFKTARDILLGSAQVNPTDTEDIEKEKEKNTPSKKTHNHSILKKPNHGTVAYDGFSSIYTHSERNFSTTLTNTVNPNFQNSHNTTVSTIYTDKNNISNLMSLEATLGLTGQNPTNETSQKFTGIARNKDANQGLHSHIYVPNDNLVQPNLEINYNNHTNTNLSNTRLPHTKTIGYNNLNVKPTPLYQGKLYHSIFIQNSLKPHPDTAIDLPTDLELLRLLLMLQPKAFTKLNFFKTN